MTVDPLAFSMCSPSLLDGLLTKAKSLLPFWKPSVLDVLASRTTAELDQAWDTHLHTLLTELKKSQEISATDKKHLRTLFEHLNSDHLHSFFDKAGDDFFEATSSPQILESIAQAVPTHKLFDALIEQNNDELIHVETWMEQLSACQLPQADIPVKTTAMHKAASRHDNVVTRFFPNLINEFMRSFEMFDSSRRRANLYERGVMMTFYFQSFSIISSLIYAINALIGNPWQTALAITALIGSAIGVLYTYLRWLRPCPDEVEYCENLTKKALNGENEPVLERDEEYRKAIAVLGQGANLLIVGEPGTGKSAFMKGLAARLPNNKLFQLRNDLIFGDNPNEDGTAKKMEQVFWDVRHYQEVKICCDEFGDALQRKKNDVELVIKSLAEKNVPFIGIMTKEQWNKLQTEQSDQVNDSKPIIERFETIFLEETSPSQTAAILQHRALRSREDLTVESAALDAILAANNHTDRHAQPRQAIRAFDRIRNRITAFNTDEYTTPELVEAQDALSKLHNKARFADSPLNSPGSQEFLDWRQQLQQARDKVARLTKTVKKQKDLAKRVIFYLKQQRYYQQALDTVASIGARPASISQETTKKIIFASFAAKKLTGKIEQALSKLNEDICLRLDKKAVATFLV